LPFLKKGKNLNPSSRKFFGNNTIGFFGFSFPLKAGLPFLCFVRKQRKQ